MRAAVYLRQSRDHGLTQLAVTRQREDCLKLCADRDWDPVEYVDNDVSATNGKVRKAYHQMLTDIRAGRIQAVVCWDLDRLHRRPIELEEFITLADDHNLVLATVGGDTDLSTDGGRLFARIKGAVARAEVERKGARQKRANQQSAKAGKPPVRRAFGYSQDGMRVMTEEAKAVKEVFTMVLAGATIVRATQWLNDQGHCTTAGGEWKRSNVRWLLLNPRYAGLRVYDGETTAGTWPAIIDEDTYRAMLSLLTDPKRKQNQGTARRWLGAGLYLCGRCAEGPRSDVRVNYRGDGNRIYRCRASAHLSRLADPIDAYVTEVITGRLRKPDLADILAVHDDDDGRELHDEAVGLRARLDSLAADYADGLLTARQVQVATERLEARLTGVEGRQAARGQRNALAAVIAKRDPAQAWLEASLSVQREVIGRLATVTLLPGTPGKFDPGSVRIDWRS